MSIRSTPQLRKFGLWEGLINAEDLAVQHPEGIDVRTQAPDESLAFTVGVVWAGGSGPWRVNLELGRFENSVRSLDADFSYERDHYELEQFFQFQAPLVSELRHVEELVFPVSLYLDDSLVIRRFLTLRRRNIVKV